MSTEPVHLSPTELRAAVVSAFRTPQKASSPGFWSSALWWAIAALIFFDLADLVWLALVLLIHEGGHLLAMKAFGYRDTRIFFLPFFGAAASGKPAGEELPWQRAVILLAGPVPGMVLGGALGVSQVLAGSEPSAFALMLVAVNLFNLLPVAPLDGGRVVLLLVPSQGLQHALKLLGGVALVALGVWMEGWILGLFGVWMAWASWKTLQAYRRAVPHRDALAIDTADPAELDAHQLAGLYALAEQSHDVSGATVETGRAVLSEMKLLHTVLQQPRVARGVERLAIAAAYLVCAGLPFAGVAWLLTAGQA